MATSISVRTDWTSTHPAKTKHTGLLGKWNVFVNNQSDKKTFWFLASLVFQGVFFLPLPALLIFYYGAPFYIVSVTLVLFFANIIAGMGGMGIRTLLGLLAISVVTHLLMFLIFVL
ncbi:MAG TPA: hypothetical protein VHA56_00955 [Mucilaginibacter sp.]|nr:hypothetical protein [Mucilaginibacter sp.]